jgi:uncharacterized protein
MKIKLFLLLMIIFCISAPLFGFDRLYDTAGLLSDDEAASLKELLDTISLTYDFDMVIVSVKQTGSTEPKDFADAFFDKNGYGLGKNRDGCLFLIITERKVFWFATSGRGKKILTSMASKRLEKDAFNTLEQGDFYNTFLNYTKTWEELLVLDSKGRTYNVLHNYNAVFVIIAWVVSIGISFLIVMLWKKSMSTAIPKKQDATYVTPGSLSFAVQQDKFLYSTVTKIERTLDSDDDDETTAAGNSENEEED